MKKFAVVLIMISALLLSSCGQKAQNPSGSSQQAQNQQSSQQAQDQSSTQNQKVEAPDFTLTTLNGKSIELYKLRGKVVVINFFATWCPPCKAEMPGFIGTMNDYKDKGVEFLFVDVQENNATVQKFLKDRNYNIDPLMDSTGEVFSDIYGSNGTPTTVVVDKEGNVAFGVVGMTDEATLRAAIEKALKE